MNEFVQRISSRSAVSGQPVDVTLWTEGDYKTSVTQTVTDNGSEPIILDNIPVNSSISINIEAAIGRKNYLGASEKIVVKRGNNSVTIKMSKTVPTTDIVLYNKTDFETTYYLANSTGTNLNSPAQFFGPVYNLADFCFDSNGNVYLGTNMDVMQFYYYDVSKKQVYQIQVLDSNNEETQITSSGFLDYDFAKNQLWFIANDNTFYKFSQLNENSPDSYSANVTVYNFRTTELGVEDPPLASCVYNDIVYLAYSTVDNEDVPFVLLEYDISSAVVDEEDPTQFYIASPKATKELCKDMDLSSEAKFTDMLYQNGCIYMLLRDYYTNSEDAPGYISISFKQNEMLGQIYSRGAVIKVNLSNNKVSQIGWTDSPLDTSEGKIYGYPSQGYDALHLCKNGGSYIKENYLTLSSSDFFYQNNIPKLYVPATEKSGLYGPQKFVAIKPKKLIIADDGIAFYTDSNGAYCYKNVNRVVTIDLESFAISESNSPVMVNTSFDSEESYMFVSSQYVSNKDDIFNVTWDSNNNVYDFQKVNYSIYGGIPLEE